MSHSGLTGLTIVRQVGWGGRKVMEGLFPGSPVISSPDTGVNPILPQAPGF